MKTYFYNIKNNKGKVIYQSKEVFTSHESLQKDIDSIKHKFDFSATIEIYSNEIK